MSAAPETTSPQGPNLTRQALELRFQGHYAGHPVEKTLEAFLSAGLKLPPALQEGECGLGFLAADLHYRSGTQGLPLSQIPKLPEALGALSRLRPLDRARQKALLMWAESQGFTWDFEDFTARWSEQGKLGGAEHHVYFDEATNRWFKRLYHGVNDSLLEKQSIAVCFCFLTKNNNFDAKRSFRDCRQSTRADLAKV